MSNSILIVDDEQGIREALSSILADEGYEPVAVSSGEECLTLLEERSIDLVLLDVWLDGIDGLDTLERIRAVSDPYENDLCDKSGSILVTTDFGPIR